MSGPPDAAPPLLGPECPGEPRESAFSGEPASSGESPGPSDPGEDAPPPLTEELLLARAYLSRVAEAPAPALGVMVAKLGAIETARRVRAGVVGLPGGLPVSVAAETRARRENDRAAADLAVVRAGGGRLLVPEDPAWPARAFAGFTVGAARRLADMVAPLALWVRGPVEVASVPQRSAAVVGARAATDYGVWVARDWSAGLADRGVAVVSGAALGIDGAAHRGALAADGVTVAVLACGVDRVYPPTHRALLEHIAARGLVLSEYPPGTPPARHRFLVRNRLIAALAAGTLVVEAGARSGARRTAHVAEILGRAVWVVPGPVTSAMSLGCHIMAREPFTVVAGRVEDVVEDVGRVGEDLAPRPWRPIRPTDGLDPEALRVHEALDLRAALDSARLAYDSGVDPDRVPTHLSDLEARGLAEREDGRWRRRRG